MSRIPFLSRPSITHLLAGKVPVETEVVVRGWVRTRRDSKGGFSFLAVSDGSCFDNIQVVCPAELANYAAEVVHLTAGCSVECTGKLVKSQGKGQSYEVQATKVAVIGMVDDPDTYPISPKQHSFEYLRDVAHLRVRTNTFGAVTRVRNTLSQAVHRFYHENGFYWVNTPIITASDCEGAGAMFKVSTLDLANMPRDDKGGVDFSRDFFGKPANLTVSGQLNVETHCMALSRVYTFGPTFRAENSNTTRHLAEFWMIEPEIAFADLQDDADLAEAFLKYIFQALLNERQDDMKFFAERIDKDAVTRLEKFVSSSFERMTYTDAIAHLEQAVAKGRKFEFPVKWGIDMQSEHERYLTEELVGRPVVVMNYPKEIKAFYMPQRRRKDRCGHGRSRPRHWRDHRRQPAGRAPRCPRRPHARSPARPRRVLLVPRPPPLRDGAPRGIWPGFRADHRLRHRPAKHPRRHPLPKNPQTRGVLGARRG